jgi:hypothetical protein
MDYIFYLMVGAPNIVQDKLEDLKTLRERPDFHPEPSTFDHICIVTERLMETNDMDLVLAGLLHDICKLDCMKINPRTGWPTSPGHAEAAARLILDNPEIMKWIAELEADVDTVAELCKHHMRFHQYGDMKASKQEAFRNMKIWDKLCFIGAADNMLEDFDIDNPMKSVKWAQKIINK